MPNSSMAVVAATSINRHLEHPRAKTSTFFGVP